MRQSAEFSAQLGAPAGAVDARVLEQVARGWGIVLPQDVLEVLSAYGDDGQNLCWTHTEDEFSDWLLGGLVGNPKYYVLPPWPARHPHRVVPLGPDPFGSEQDRDIETRDASRPGAGEPGRFVCPACRAGADVASVFAQWCLACESEVDFVIDAP